LLSCDPAPEVPAWLVTDPKSTDRDEHLLVVEPLRLALKNCHTVFDKLRGLVDSWPKTPPAN
jgi:hypothetical protein